MFIPKKCHFSVKVEIIEIKLIPPSPLFTLSMANNSVKAEMTKIILNVEHDSNLEKIALGLKRFYVNDRQKLR